jgi:hypothetical protein
LPDSATAAGSYSSVRFNHKPNQSGGSRRTKITAAKNSNYKLDIVDRENDKTSTYSYAGRQKKTDKSKKRYVLTFDSEKQSCTLLPLEQSFIFNIRSTPWESSAEKLTEQYSQLRDKSESSSSGSESEGGRVSGSDGEHDASNPFNYRNYLNQPRNRSRSPSPAPSTSSAHLAPPRQQHGHRTGASRDRSISAPEPVTAATAARAAATVASRPSTASRPLVGPSPKIRLERRASTRPDDPKPAPAPLRKTAAKPKPKPKPAAKPAKPPARGATSARAPLSKATISDSDEDADGEPVSPPLAPAAFAITTPVRATASATASAPPSGKSAATADHDADVEENADEDDDGYGFQFGGGVGGLEIVLGDEEEEAPAATARKRAATLPGGGHGGGPISLRSAANSAANSPGSGVGLRAEAEDDGEEDGDGEVDEDIEPMSLGPSALGPLDGEDDFDFEAEMLQTLAAGEDGMDVDPVRLPESDSESEAE